MNTCCGVPIFPLVREENRKLDYQVGAVRVEYADAKDEWYIAPIVLTVSDLQVLLVSKRDELHYEGLARDLAEWLSAWNARKETK